MKCISIFKCNPQIEVIDKSHCFLEDVPNFQNYSRSLEELFLDYNKLTVLNDNIFRLTKLRRLVLNDNYIRDIPPDIAKLVNLVELDCSRNDIHVIPDQIKFLRGLQICDFSTNSIEELSPGLMQLKNLTCLSLSNCRIGNLPEDIGLLKNLESLELRENDLESLPSGIGGLENLKNLDIGNNAITELPDEIGRLTKLEYLLVDENNLETVPAKIGRLENLQCLDISKQKFGLKFLPEEIGGLVSLTDLRLSKNHLNTLPEGISNLKSLTIFEADDNYLSELTPGIGGCIALQELVLTSNHIEKLPSSIGSLTDLRSLNVDINRLDSLTPYIGNLKNLRILSLRDNFLSRVPKEIGQLEMIQVMDLSGNRLEYLPVSITALSLKALWLSKNQTRPLPKLQIDELPSGTKVLTCYLLPQQSDGYSDGRLVPDDDLNNQMQPEVENIDPNRKAAVTFDAETADEGELDSNAMFIRHDTPHPRQLRAWHQKLFTNMEKPALKGHDNASFSMADNPQQDPERDYTVQEQPKLVPSYQHIQYESNGLPEIPPPQLQPKPQLGNVATIVREINYHTQESKNHVNYDDGKDYSGKENSFAHNNNNNSKWEVERTPKGSPQKQKSLIDRFDDDSHNITSGTKGYILDILVRRSKNHKPGLGLCIAGGKDTPPYKDNDEGIFVSKVTVGGPAEAAGVKIGDKILAVNSNIFHEGITHQKAVDIFKKVKPDCVEFTMRVLRDPNFEPEDERPDDEDYAIKPDSVVTSNSRITEKSSTNNSNFTRTYTIPVTSETNGSGTMNSLRQFLMKEPEKVKSAASTLPPGMSLLDNSLNKNIIYTTLVKDYKHDLGLVLENRTDDSESRSNWSNIMISQIQPNSIASRDGKLQVDDRLLSINGADVTGIDLDRIMLMLEGTERFIRIVVSRGENDDPIGAALRDMPPRPQLGSWFSSTSNMLHRPSLIESYQRPTFGSASNLQKQQSQQQNITKPPKPPKPTHLIGGRDSEQASPVSPVQFEDNPTARPRARGLGLSEQSSQMSDAEKRAAWRRERLKSIEDDVEMAKLIAEAQRRRREEK